MEQHIHRRPLVVDRRAGADNGAQFETDGVSLTLTKSEVKKALPAF